VKSEMRRSLANQSFEEKIAKVSELIRLAKASGKGGKILAQLDTASAQLDAGRGVPIAKVRENIGRLATPPKNSKK